MNDPKNLADVFVESMQEIAKTGKITEMRLHALLVCMSGVLRTLASDPEVATRLAASITDAAEGMQGVALGYPITDDFLSARTATLLKMLPPELQKLVQLPE